MSAFQGIYTTFQVLVLLGELGDVVLVDGTKAFTRLLVEVAKRFANVLKLGCNIAGDVAGEFLPLVHLESGLLEQAKGMSAKKRWVSTSEWWMMVMKDTEG